MKTMLRCTLPLLMTLTLVGCQTTTSTPQPAQPTVEVAQGAWFTHQENLERLQTYQARGKFAYISGSRIDTANFAWLQKSATDYRLLLTTSFGNKIVELNVSAGQTQLTDDNNRLYLSDNPQKLVSELTGMQIPLDNLRAWLIGLPGYSKTYKLNTDFQLEQLTYNDNGALWQVNYRSYHTETFPVLPKEMELTLKQDKIKIKVNQWDL